MLIGSEWLEKSMPIRYNRAYTAYPICVTARASLLTGMNAIRNGVTDNGLWLRPDHTDFTDAHKQKIRLHYAALVRQIDYEVGQIMDTLAEEKLLESTVTLRANRFSST